MNLLNLGAGVDISGFCVKMHDFVQIMGYVLLIFKIAIPLIIIALGMFDFGKAVIAEKEDEIKKQTKRLIYRVIAGIVIFLIPSIVSWIFGLLSDYNTDKNTADSAGFSVCEKCILHPKDC